MWLFFAKIQARLLHTFLCMQTQMYRFWKPAFVFTWESHLNVSSTGLNKVIVNIIDPGYKTQMLAYFASQEKLIEESGLAIKKKKNLSWHSHSFTQAQCIWHPPSLKSYSSQAFQFLSFTSLYLTDWYFPVCSL